jgi:hypothetical protein
MRLTAVIDAAAAGKEAIAAAGHDDLPGAACSGWTTGLAADGAAADIGGEPTALAGIMLAVTAIPAPHVQPAHCPWLRASPNRLTCADPPRSNERPSENRPK